jgi:hypothetical protein
MGVEHIASWMAKSGVHLRDVAAVRKHNIHVIRRERGRRQ